MSSVPSDDGIDPSVMGIELERINFGDEPPEEPLHLAAAPPVYPEPLAVVQPVHGGLWEFIQRFDFSWYAWSVGTGITSILIHALSDWDPAHKDHIITTSFAYFGISFVLFFVMSGLTIARYCKWPRLFLITMKHPGQAGFTALMPMALSNIIIMFSKLVGKSQKGITAIWVIYITGCREPDMGYFLPIAALIVAAAAGSDIAATLDERRASITIITSFVIVVMGLIHLVFVFISDLTRLIGRRIVPSKHITDAFVTLTVLAQCGLAAQQVGEQAFRIIPKSENLLDGTGKKNISLAEYCHSTGLAFAIGLWSFGSVYFIILCFLSRSTKILANPFSNLNWWGLQFSFGFFALSTQKLGTGPPGRAFTTIGSFLGALAILLYHHVSFNLIKFVKNGDIDGLLNAPELTGPGNRQAEHINPTPPWYKRWAVKALYMATRVVRIIFLTYGDPTIETS
ncbi:hypothetical protein E0Z10_g8370 [Xylaria hypoxylon]|uniref:Uncharacterized protein n=1 Tax=Xylaria hypoxylon TaxID=37992 RepID=A0A4Z0YN22_9PEZI|nr:hypothetical protein E0Z10_g8370 [Xylaria hypoxylon]